MTNFPDMNKEELKCYLTTKIKFSNAPGDYWGGGEEVLQITPPPSNH